MILQRIATSRVLSTIISPRRPCCFSRTLISNSNSSNNLLFPRRNNNDVIKPTTTPFALQSRSAHAQPITFEWEEKRKSSWGVSTPEDLEKRINRIRKLTTEAHLCIKDCAESIHTPHFQEELQSATQSVHNVESAYSELLEELASHNSVELLNELRRVYSGEVQSVKEELRGALERLKNG